MFDQNALVVLVVNRPRQETRKPHWHWRCHRTRLVNFQRAQVVSFLRTPTLMTSNAAKSLSYIEAWRRIKAATEGGFDFEAVAHCESIILDRLLSCVCGVDPSGNASAHAAFAKLIDDWRKLARTRPAHEPRSWRRRGRVAHGTQQRCSCPHKICAGCPNR